MTIVVNNLPDNTGDIIDAGSIPRLGRSAGGGNPLQYSCLENPMDRVGWQAMWDRKKSDTTKVT